MFIGVSQLIPLPQALLKLLWPPHVNTTSLSLPAACGASIRRWQPPAHRQTFYYPQRCPCWPQSGSHRCPPDWASAGNQDCAGERELGLGLNKSSSVTELCLPVVSMGRVLLGGLPWCSCYRERGDGVDIPVSRGSSGEEGV